MWLPDNIASFPNPSAAPVKQMVEKRGSFYYRATILHILQIHISDVVQIKDRDGGREHDGHPGRSSHFPVPGQNIVAEGYLLVCYSLFKLARENSHEIEVAEVAS